MLFEGIKKYRDADYVRSAISVNVEEVKGRYFCQGLSDNKLHGIWKGVFLPENYEKISDLAMQNREVQGAKVQLAGRLNGGGNRQNRMVFKGSFRYDSPGEY